MNGPLLFWFGLGCFAAGMGAALALIGLVDWLAKRQAVRS